MLFTHFLQDEDDDEDDGKEVEGKLTPSGKELEKLLGRVGGDNNSDEDTDEDYDDDRDDVILLLFIYIFHVPFPLSF